MSVLFVQSNQVMNVNGNIYSFYNNPGGTSMQIPCENTEIIGTFWMIPQVVGNRIVGYTFLSAPNTNVKPQPDALKVLRVKLTDTGGITQIDFAVVDADNSAFASPYNQFAYLCDGLGGSLPVMPLVTIPAPIVQGGPVSTNTTTGANTFVFALPTNPSGLLYQVNAFYINGAPIVPTFVPTGITTAAQFVTYANANWSAYGSWTNPSGDIVQLVSLPTSGTFVQNAGLDVQLKAVTTCLNVSAYSAGQNINGIQFGAGPIIPITPFIMTNNPAVLQAGIQPYVASKTIFSTGIAANTLGVTNTQPAITLYNGATSILTAVPGTC
jgi:hypothetical protein